MVNKTINTYHLLKVYQSLSECIIVFVNEEHICKNEHQHGILYLW